MKPPTEKSPIPRHSLRQVLLLAVFLSLGLLQCSPGQKASKEESTPRIPPPSRDTLAAQMGHKDNSTKPPTVEPEKVSPSASTHFQGLFKGKDATGLPALGGQSPVATVLFYSDLECPYSRRLITKAFTLAKKHPNRIRLVYKHLPLPFHKNAHKYATLVECAQEQNMFWEAVSHIVGQPRTATVTVHSLALALSMDEQRLKGCMDTGNTKNIVNTQIQDAKAQGVRGTPTVFVNGVRTSNYLTALSKVDTMLTKSKP
ncbi:DsbA family protein [Myxococcota bacterium]|nr:DsbA family protein [Myxococcota bacterium]MBU1536286.1 DsbA family protein [Myxococcota bacterium]